MRDLIVILAVFGGLPYVFTRPFFGLVMFSWLAYMRPQDLCWGPARGLRFSLLVGVAMMVGWGLYERRPFTKAFPQRKWLIGLLVFITTSMFLNTMHYPDKQITKWLDLVKVFAVAAFTVGIVDDKKRLNILLWTIAMSLGFYGIKGGLFGIFTGGRIMQGPGGMLKDNNDLCMAMAMILPFWFYLGQGSTDRRVRKWTKVAVFLIVVTIIITTSRGGFLTLVGVGALMVWRSRQRMIGVGVGLAAAMLLILFLPKDVRARLDTLKDPTQEGSAAGRLHAWNVAFHMWKANPILGVGYQNFTWEFRAYDPTPKELWQFGKNVRSVRVTHNSYLQLLAESGAPAVICFMMLLFGTWLQMWLLRRTNRVREGPRWITEYAMMIETSLLAYFIGGMFLNRAHFDLLYHVVALGACINLIARAELKELAEQRLTMAKAESAPQWARA